MVAKCVIEVDCVAHYHFVPVLVEDGGNVHRRILVLDHFQVRQLLDELGGVVIPAWVHHLNGHIQCVDLIMVEREERYVVPAKVFQTGRVDVKLNGVGVWSIVYKVRQANPISRLYYEVVSAEILIDKIHA